MLDTRFVGEFEVEVGALGRVDGYAVGFYCVSGFGRQGWDGFADDQTKPHRNVLPFFARLRD